MKLNLKLDLFDIACMDFLTQDTFFNGKIKIRQNQNGYRFSIDPILLAYYAAPKKNDKIIDLGTGCGIIPLIISYRTPDVKIFGIEIQKELAQTAMLNIIKNNMEDRINIIHQDMKFLNHNITKGPVDIVMSNPPYRQINSGRINPNNEKAIARHEIKIKLKELIKISSNMLRTGGKFLTIYPAERLSDIIVHMCQYKIEPKKLKMIHSTKESEAKLFLIEGAKMGRPGIKIAPPLIIYKKDKIYTSDVEKCFMP